MILKNLILKPTCFIVALFIVFTSCKKKDENNSDPAPVKSDLEKTIKELAVEKGFDSLAVALTQTGLISNFDESTDAKTTVFAPTNAAFVALLQSLGLNKISDVNKDVLSEILLYHVLSGEVKSSTLTEGQLAKTLSGKTFRISLAGGAKIFTKASKSVSISSVDVVGSNGVIHVINEVLVPNAPGVPGNTATKPTKTIATTAVDAGFDSLVVALTRLNLVSTFNDSKASFTVFAPTNAAFQNLCSTLGVASIAEIDLATLTATINYHAVNGVISSPQLANNQSIVPLSTASDKALKVLISGSTVQLKDYNQSTINVTSADVWCTNGIIHVIDNVLLPVTVITK
jgi:transforming growth factor-beta-induced protein